VDAVEVIEHCFPGAKAALPDKLKVTIRVVRLFSQNGDARQQAGAVMKVKGFMKLTTG
jgi:hypothetical protein